MQRLVVGLAVIVALLLGLYVAMQITDIDGDDQNTKADASVPIGGAFSLQNHRGEAVTDQTYSGKILLIYFGFTYCPDVCPTELQKISAALDMQPEGTLANIVPLFITVDPDRDTVEQLALYLDNFHPAIIGLTGSAEQIKQAASAYRIYMKKVADDGSSADYTMDHSNLIYLMSGENHYIAHFTARSTAPEIAAKLRQAASGR